MKKIVTVASFVFVSMLPLAALTPAVEGCTPAEVQTVNTAVNDAVNASQFVCIMASPLVKAPELAVACSIVQDVAKATPELLAFLDQLIAQRETFKKAGYSYDKATARWMR